MKTVSVLIFFFTIAINAQNTAYSRIDQIGSLVSSIPLTMVKNNGYNQIEVSSQAYKKSWMFFKNEENSRSIRTTYSIDCN